MAPLRETYGVFPVPVPLFPIVIDELTSAPIFLSANVSLQMISAFLFHPPTPKEHFFFK